MRYLNQSLDYIRRVLRHPVEELNQHQRRARRFVEFLRHCSRQLREDRAEQMAAALTFRTVFSLVPLFVLGLIVFRVFGGFDQVQEELEEPLFKLFGVFEVPAEGYLASSTPGASPTEFDDPATRKSEVAVVEVQPLEETVAEKKADLEAAGERSSNADEEEELDRQQLRVSVRKVLNDAIAKFYALDFGTVGIGGLALFLYAALALTFSVEYNFNVIFKASRQRSWKVRLPIYWAMITLGISLIWITFWITGTFQARIQEVAGRGWGVLNVVTAVVVSWVLLFLLYFLMPNTKVRARSALLGSLLAAVLWEAGKVGFQKYVDAALPFSTFYGTLGLLPLFLFWIYISWVIVLFGAEFTYAAQSMRRRWVAPRTSNDGCGQIIDPSWVVSLMSSIAQGFADGRTVQEEELAAQSALPVRSVRIACRQLVEEGLLHGVERSGSECAYCLAMPPDAIRLRRLLRLGRRMSVSGTQGSPHMDAFISELRQAEDAAVDDRTLADVCDLTPGSAS